MTSAGSSARRSGRDAYALGRSFATLCARRRRHDASRSAATAATSSPDARSRAGPRPDRGRHRRRADRHGADADALFRRRRCSTSTAASRSPAATTRPTTTASRCCSTAARSSAQEIQELGRRAAAGDWSEGAGTVEEVDIARRLCRPAARGLSTATPTGSAGTPATAPPGRSLEKLVERLPGEHHLLFTEVDGTFPQPPSRSDRVEANLADLKALVARQAARLRHRLRRRRRPHRRGRRPGPGDLGRPAAADPRRAGAEGRCPARRSSPTSRRARCCSTASPSSAASR